MVLPELGGIQMEAGDSFQCLCDQCRARRAEMRGGEKRLPAFSLSDMAGIYPEAADVIRSRSSDAWVICETYTHYINNNAFNDVTSPAMQAMLKMPDETCGSGATVILASGLDPGGSSPEHCVVPACDVLTTVPNGRAVAALGSGPIRQQYRLSYATGIQGVSMFRDVALSRQHRIDYLVCSICRPSHGFCPVLC